MLFQHLTDCLLMFTHVVSRIKCVRVKSEDTATLELPQLSALVLLHNGPCEITLLSSHSLLVAFSSVLFFTLAHQHNFSPSAYVLSFMGMHFGTCTKRSCGGRESMASRAGCTQQQRSTLQHKAETPEISLILPVFCVNQEKET